MQLDLFANQNAKNLSKSQDKGLLKEKNVGVSRATASKSTKTDDFKNHLKDSHSVQNNADTPRKDIDGRSKIKEKTGEKVAESKSKLNSELTENVENGVENGVKETSKPMETLAMSAAERRKKQSQEEENGVIAAALGGVDNIAQQVPALALVSGKLEHINPKDIIKVVSENPFIKNAMSHSDVSGYLQEPGKISSKLMEFGFEVATLQGLHKKGVDITGEASAYDLIKEMGLDPQRVVAELAVLKDNLSLEGVASYVKRAESMNAQALNTEGSIPGAEDNNQSTGQPQAIVQAVNTQIAAQMGAEQTPLNSDQITELKAAPAQSIQPLDAQAVNESSHGFVRESADSLDNATVRTDSESGEAAFKIGDQTTHTQATPEQAMHPQAQRSDGVDYFGNETSTSTISELQAIYGREEGMLADSSVSQSSGKFDPGLNQASQLNLLGQSIPQAGLNLAQVGAVSSQGLPQQRFQVRNISLDSRPQAEELTIANGGYASYIDKNNQIMNPLTVKLADSASQGTFTTKSPEFNLDLDRMAFESQVDLFDADLSRESVPAEIQIEMPDSANSNPSFSEGEGLAERSWMQNPGNLATFSPEEATFETNLVDVQLNERVQQTVLERSEILVRDGGGEMVVDLGDKDTGKLEVRINVDGQEVELQIAAENEKVREFLKTEMPSLKQALLEKELHLTEANIDAQAQFSSHSDTNSRQFREAFENLGSKAGDLGSKIENLSTKALSRMAANFNRPIQLKTSGGGIQVLV